MLKLDKIERSVILYELKTKETANDVIEFMVSIDSVGKRQDAYRLLDIFTEVTGYKAKMWGASIIGFGKYQYKYESGHEGLAPLVGFSPRKTRHSLYFASGTWCDRLLEELGKHKAGKACVYINKVDDIDTEVLKKLIAESVHYLQTKHPENTIL